MFNEAEDAGFAYCCYLEGRGSWEEGEEGKKEGGTNLLAEVNEFADSFE